MKMLLRKLALLFLTGLSSLSAMAQFTTMPSDLSSYKNVARQSTLPSQTVMMPSDKTQMASLSEQTGLPDQMAQMLSRKRNRGGQQSTTSVGATTVNGTTIVGATMFTNTGNIEVSPRFNIKYGDEGQLGTNPYSAPATTSPVAGTATGTTQTGVTGTSVADTAKIQADEQIRAQNAVAASQRKCASKSSIWGLIGAAVGGYFGGPAGAAVGSTAVGSSAAKNC